MRRIALSHLRLHLLPEQELLLPAHNKGNSVRGGFGNAFRKLVCVDRRWECAECTLRYTCPYTIVFNPFIPPDAPQFSGNLNIPRPFVFKPPLSDRTRYEPGESVVLDLVLVGRVIDYLPYFIVSFRELGASGFGLNRAAVRLARVDSLALDGEAATIYDSGSNVVRPPPPMMMPVADARATGERPSAPLPGEPVDFRHGESPLPSRRGGQEGFWNGSCEQIPLNPLLRRSSGHALPNGEGSSPARQAALSTALWGERKAQGLTLTFLTPTTLKAGSDVGRPGTLVRRPAFHHILKRLRDRVNALATFYGEGPLPLDFKGLGEAAERVETMDDQTHWVDRVRVSRRREVTHDLSGFVGRITVRGHLAPFWSLLRIGEYVHVGKNAVFGNGWFSIEPDPSS